MSNIIFQIVEGQIKTQITDQILGLIHDGISSGITYTEKSLLATLRANVGYEISLDGDDKKKIFKILQKIDPKQYKKYAIQTRDEDTNDIVSPLRNNTSYVICLHKLRTYLLVSTRCWDANSSTYAYSDEVHVFIFGIYASEINRMFLEVLEPSREMIIKERKLNSLIVRVFSVELSKDKESVYFDGGNRERTKTISQIFTDNKGKITELINYINQWTKASEFFYEKGIGYKMGILLYGPPGTGKTSLAKSLAGYFNMDLFTLNLEDFCSITVNKLRNYKPRDPYILLLEDIDYIFGKREDNSTTEEKERSNLLLQFLDGAKSATNAIIIATTNCYESLDSAIVRDGRFDFKILMDNIGQEEAEEMIKELNITTVPFPTEDLEFPINPAKLQNLVVQHVFSNIESIDIYSSAEDNLEEDFSCGK